MYPFHLKLTAVIFVLWLSYTPRCWGFSTDNVSILLLGDSLSASYGMPEQQGWVALLNQQFKKEQLPYHIVNASISGETTGGGLARLPGLLSEQPVDIVLIELGGNDGLRGFPPQTIQNNLLQIIQIAKQQNTWPAIMAIEIPPNYGQRYNQLFRAIFPAVAEQAQIPLIPFFMLAIADKPELIQADGIHPTVAAQPIIVRLMYQQILQLVQRYQQAQQSISTVH
jgi:acyl-CoA thioesterase-1